ncbi:hypothetical protein [Mesorhizobium sp. P5_C1]
MPHEPVTTYVVSVFEKPHWRTVLTTKDKDKALAMAKEIGDKVRVEEITPKALTALACQCMPYGDA